MRTIPFSLFLHVLFLLAVPRAAEAYIGPGAGITVFGTVIALVAAVLLALLGFIWYPLKRLRAKLAKKKAAKTSNPS
jgi:hypothetical protein